MHKLHNPKLSLGPFNNFGDLKEEQLKRVNWEFVLYLIAMAS